MRVRWAWIVAAAAMGAGCVPTQPQRPAARPAPPESKPMAIGLLVSNLNDTNLNWYRDTTMVRVYLYPDPAVSPLSMHVDGEFTFRLIALDGRTLAEWHFDGESSRAAANELWIGPGYEFRLSLLDVGSDELEEREAFMGCLFKPTAGGGVLSKLTDAPVMIGRVSTRRGAAGAGGP